MDDIIMENVKRIENVYTNEEFQIIKYKPNLVKPFYIEMEPTTILRRVRFFIEYIYGYNVYYLKKENTFIGYCTITSGRNPRFWFANKKDIIIGPYFILEKQRGNGYAKKMVSTIINFCETNWQNGYVIIKKNNIPSISVTEMVDGELMFYVHNNVVKKLIRKESGEYGIYKIENMRTSK